MDISDIPQELLWIIRCSKRLPKSDIEIVMGDLNAKVDNTLRGHVIGRHSLDELSNKSEKFTDSRHVHRVVIGDSCLATKIYLDQPPRHQ